MKAALSKPYMTDGGRAVYVFSYYLNDHSSQKKQNGLTILMIIAVKKTRMGLTGQRIPK